MGFNDARRARDLARKKRERVRKWDAANRELKRELTRKWRAAKSQQSAADQFFIMAGAAETLADLTHEQA